MSLRRLHGDEHVIHKSTRRLHRRQEAEADAVERFPRVRDAHVHPDLWTPIVDETPEDDPLLSVHLLPLRGERSRELRHVLDVLSTTVQRERERELPYHLAHAASSASASNIFITRGRIVSP